MTAEAARPFPWAEILRLAFGVLRWPPETVWRATPREIAAALGPARSGEPMRRDEFQALLSAYPDPTNRA